MTMKLVVTGMPGLSRCSRSRSAWKHSSSASELNRAKSSCWVGLAKVGAVRGGRTSSNVAVALAPERGAPRLVQPRRRPGSASAARRGTPRPRRRSSSARCGRRARWTRATARARGGRGTAPPAPSPAPARARGTPASWGTRPAGRRARARCRRPCGGAPRGAPRSATAAATRWPSPGRRRCRARAAGPSPRRASRARTCRCCGSSSAQENTPTVATVTPASRIRRTSSAQVSRGHCSGL